MQFIERVENFHAANTHDNDNYQHHICGQSVEYGNCFGLSNWGYYPTFVPISMHCKKIWRQPVRDTDHLVPGLVGTMSTDTYLQVEAPNFQRRYYNIARSGTPQEYYWVGTGMVVLCVVPCSYSRNRLTVESVFITAASDNTIINIQLQQLHLLNEWNELVVLTRIGLIYYTRFDLTRRNVLCTFVFAPPCPCLPRHTHTHKH